FAGSIPWVRSSARCCRRGWVAAGRTTVRCPTRVARTVLVVCQANTCRSVMAHALLEQMLAARGLDGRIRVTSGGIGPRPRVGVLSDHVKLAAIFVQGLRDADWEVSEEVIVERRGGAPGADRWRAAARELVARRVSALVAGDHAAARAAREATDAIPIVAIDFEGDAIVSGFVRSLARPGGNVTGFFCDFGDAMSELTKALRAAVPKARQLLALTDGEATEIQARALRETARALDLAVDTVALGAAGPEALVDRVAAARVALVVLASPRLESEASRLAKRAIRRKMASAGAFIRYA